MKKVVIWNISIWYVIITEVNYVLGLPWKLLLHDIFSGFRDNRFYFTHIFVPVTFLTILMNGILLLIYKRKLLLSWRIRIRRRVMLIGEFKHLRKYARTIWGVVVTAALCLSVMLLTKAAFQYKNEAWRGALTVAHAGGKIDEHYYSNCLEAIQVNYEKGQRVFEIDFSVTSDNKLVCKHDWDYVVQEGGIIGEVWDEERFLSAPIFGRYTPLSFGTLCQVMAEYPDLWIITDTKDIDLELVQNEFEVMVDTASELGLEVVLDRVIVQIYNEEMYDTVHSVYPFKAYIYTLYQFFGGDAETFRECVRFCYGHNIDSIATWNYFVTPELLRIADEYGIAVYAHTEDDVENARDMIRQGLTGVYTNIITPDLLKED